MDVTQKKYGVSVKIAVLCIIMVQYTITLTTPILGAINQAYPGEDYQMWIKLIETAPTLTMIPVCFLVGPLLKVFRKKTLLLAGTVLACGQCIPFFIDGFGVILAGRLISGLGMGICYPFAGSYILDLFRGEECDSMMGWRATVGAVGGVFILQFSGILADLYTYQTSFSVAFICIPLFIIMFFFIPDIDKRHLKEREKETAAVSVEKTRKKKTYTVATWAIILANIGTMIFSYTYMTTTSIVICASKTQGGLSLTSADASNALTVMSIVMALSGLIYGKIFVKIFRSYVTEFGLFMLGLGILISYLAHSMTIMYLAAIAFGIGFQVYNAAVLQILAKTTMPQAVAAVTAVFFAFNSIGQFLSSAVVPRLTQVLLNDSLRGDWLISFISLFIVFAVWVSTRMAMRMRLSREG